MRAKFRCNNVKFYGDPNDPNTAREYELSAVYDGRTEENRRFNKATPLGTLSMRVDNPNARLEVGEEYYLDFTPTFLARHERTPEAMGNVHATPAGRYEPGARIVPEPYEPGVGQHPGHTTEARHAAPEAGTSKGYITTPDLATTQPMDPAEVTAEDDITTPYGDTTTRTGSSERQ